MPYLIGTDEAGYGPNLGPLVISASVWEVPEGVTSELLATRLESAVVSRVGQLSGNGHARVAIADSKVLYQSGSGLRHLERGLWAALEILRWATPVCWSQMCQSLDPDSFDRLRSLPWYADYDPSLPIDAKADELAEVAQAVREKFAAAEVRILDLKSRVVAAEQFNSLLDQFGSKGLALSHLTLELAAQMATALPEGPITIICDKHGGRNRYSGLLSDHFPEALVEIYEEGRTRSLYRFGPPQRRIEARFQVKAESHLPVALASMTSKYLRELAMAAVNRFWARHVEGLRPTAGYPQDARRFRQEISAAVAELGIDEAMFWRIK